MKKIIGRAALSVFLLTVSISLAQAETAPASVEAQLDRIKQLMQQVQQLQTQLDALKAQQKNLQQETREEVKELAAMLREGDTGEHVKVLQALLAADFDIYPEALITGYYGARTSAGVKRFQKKHGLEQVGHVGPKTLKKLNEKIKDSPLMLEDDDNGKKHLCAKVPPGHLIAPGWLKKHDGLRPVVPECQKLPKGIEKNLNGVVSPPPQPPPPPTATSTDTNPPTVVFLTPATSTVLRGVVTLTASATDNTGVVRVQYFCNSTLIDDSVTIPYSVPFTTMTCGEGSKVLSAKAYDAAGNIGETNVLITISNGVLSTLSAPGGDIWGLAWDGSNFWTATPNGYLYRMNASGTVLNTLYVGTFNTGLAWDGADLWASYGNIVVRYNTDGVQQKLFEFSSASHWITGMAWDGSALWAIDRGARKLYRVHRTSGNIEETVPVPGNWLLLDGLDYYDNYFWATDAETDTLIQLTKTGVIVRTYALPGAVPTDLAFAGSNLWVADLDDNAIRNIDISKLAPGVGDPNATQ